MYDSQTHPKRCGDSESALRRLACGEKEMTSNPTSFPQLYTSQIPFSGLEISQGLSGQHVGSTDSGTRHNS